MSMPNDAARMRCCARSVPKRGPGKNLERGPCFARTGQALVEMPKFGRIGTRLAPFFRRSGPESANIGPESTKISPSSANTGQRSAHHLTTGKYFGPASANF